MNSTRLLLFTLLVSIANVPAADLPPPVPGFPIGRCVDIIGVKTPEEAKQVGFEYLEVALPKLLPMSDEEFAAQEKRLRAIGLPMLSGYGFLPGDLKIVGPDVDTNKIHQALQHGLSRARQLGMSMVVYGNGLSATRKVPEGFSRDAAYAQFLDFARAASAEAKRFDLTILIEPMPRESTDLVNTLAEGLEFVEKVGHPNCQLLVDYTTFVQAKEDPALLKRAAPHIRQVEIQNPNGRIYPVAADESDYASFIRALKQSGYRGGFSIHGKPGDVFVNGPKAITLLRTLAAAPVEVKP